jgi:hypothetical protein
MKNIKTFEAFLNEEGEEKKDKAAPAPAEEKPTIDSDKEKLKTFEINGVTYEGVLSTFEAIANKQKAMGEAEVGVISLPGEESAYELFKKEEKESDDEDSDDEESDDDELSI